MTEHWILGPRFLEFSNNHKHCLEQIRDFSQISKATIRLQPVYFNLQFEAIFWTNIPNNFGYGCS